MTQVKDMNFEEKLQLLHEKDKIYLDGYIDRAIREFEVKKSPQQQSGRPA